MPTVMKFLIKWLGRKPEVLKLMYGVPFRYR